MQFCFHIQMFQLICWCMIISYLNKLKIVHNWPEIWNIITLFHFLMLKAVLYVCKGILGSIESRWTYWYYFVLTCLCVYCPTIININESLPILLVSSLHASCRNIVFISQFGIFNSLMKLKADLVSFLSQYVLEQYQYYHNDPKFRTDMSGQSVQTQIRLRVYIVCHSDCIVWTHYSMVDPHSSNFRVITTNFLGVRRFRKFTVDFLQTQTGK